jgi:hypothetical protein
MIAAIAHFLVRARNEGRKRTPFYDDYPDIG